VSLQCSFGAPVLELYVKLIPQFLQIALFSRNCVPAISTSCKVGLVRAGVTLERQISPPTLKDTSALIHALLGGVVALDTQKLQIILIPK